MGQASIATAATLSMSPSYADPPTTGAAMPRLPRTGIHHNLPAAWFALRCLAAVAIRPFRPNH